MVKNAIRLYYVQKGEQQPPNYIIHKASKLFDIELELATEIYKEYRKEYRRNINYE